MKNEEEHVMSMDDDDIEESSVLVWMSLKELLDVAEEGLTGATGWSTCHTRGSSGSAVCSGVSTDRFRKEREPKNRGSEIKWVWSIC